MENQFTNGWLAEEEPAAMWQLFGNPESDIEIVSEDDAMTIIKEAAETPIKTHPWDMTEQLYKLGECPYSQLTTYNQDANNCAGHGTSKAIDAFMLISAWMRARYELTPFETFVPWIWGVGKNEAGHPGTGGASMGAMLSMIVKNGVLPADTSGIPEYRGTSNAWARNHGRQAKNAPYSEYWPIARKYTIKAAQLPKSEEAFYLACKGGFSVGFGTSQQIRMSGRDKIRTWTVSGGWMHAMAGYGYSPDLDAVGIDNSHGDGFAWASRSVLKSVVDRARYFDGFVILGMTPRPGKPDWSPIGRS